MPLVHPFETSFGRVSSHSVLISKAVLRGKTGYGECPASEYPYYSSETVVTAEYVINQFIIPLVDDDLIYDPSRAPEVFSRIRGHNMAKACVEMALWDLKAKLEGIPLYILYGGSRKYTESGVSIGIEGSTEALMERIAGAVSDGYKRIKIKIKPGFDVDVLENIRLSYPELPLMVDANGCYSGESFAWLKRLDDFGLMMIEQPFGYNDFVLHSEFQKSVRTPVCLDESIKSYDDAVTAIKLGACRIINIKQARVGGPSAARKIHDLCLKNGIKMWCGGLLETGVGRLHNLALSSLEGFSLPGDIGASRRYYSPDIIEPEVEVKGGKILMREGPGIGARVATL